MVFVAETVERILIYPFVQSNLSWNRLTFKNIFFLHGHKLTFLSFLLNFSLLYRTYLFFVRDEKTRSLGTLFFMRNYLKKLLERKDKQTYVASRICRLFLGITGNSGIFRFFQIWGRSYLYCS